MVAGDIQMGFVSSSGIELGGHADSGSTMLPRKVHRFVADALQRARRGPVLLRAAQQKFMAIASSCIE